MGKAAKYIAVLGAALALSSAAAGALAAQKYGQGAYAASAAAAAINWAAGGVALAVIGASSRQSWRSHAALLAMAGRMALPLAAVAYFSRSQNWWAAHGVVGLIAVHYLVGLVIETLMSVRLAATDADAIIPPSETPPPGLTA